MWVLPEVTCDYSPFLHCQLSRKNWMYSIFFLSSISCYHKQILNKKAKNLPSTKFKGYFSLPFLFKHFSVFDTNYHSFLLENIFPSPSCSVSLLFIIISFQVSSWLFLLYYPIKQWCVSQGLFLGSFLFCIKPTLRNLYLCMLVYPLNCVCSSNPTSKF